MLRLTIRSWRGRAPASPRREGRPRRTCRPEVEPQERRALLSAGFPGAAAFEALSAKAGGPAVSGRVSPRAAVPLRITPPTGILETGEDGRTASFTVELGNRRSRVTLRLMSSDRTEVGFPTDGGIADQKVLTLTPRNRKATVTIVGVNDGNREGNQTYRIQILARNVARGRNHPPWLDTGKNITVLHRDPVTATPSPIVPGEPTAPVTPPTPPQPPPARLPGYKITLGPTWESAGTDPLKVKLYQLVMQGTVTGPVGATFILGGREAGTPKDPTGDTASSGWQPAAWTGDKSPPIEFTRSAADPETMTWAYRSGKEYGGPWQRPFEFKMVGTDGEVYFDELVSIPPTPSD